MPKKKPSISRGHLQPPTAYVRDFTGLGLPIQSDSLNFHATTEWFSDDTPRADPNIVLTWSIPSRKIPETLEAAVGQGSVNTL